jgi:hypothetical protein
MPIIKKEPVSGPVGAGQELNRLAELAGKTANGAVPGNG